MAISIPILFESADILAVCKPEGLTSIPGSEKGKDTLVEMLSKQYDQKPVSYTHLTLPTKRIV